MGDSPQGYDPDLFEDADKLQEHELICSVCECVIKDAMETPCGHLFCRECVLNCMKHSPTCPIDRKELKENELNRSVRVDRLVGRQQVHCAQKEEGCTWVGQFSDMDGHTGKKCDFIIIVCENKQNGCEVQIIRKAYPEHLAECKFRFIDCQYCKVKVVEPQVTEHLRTCPKLPIDCPNECKTADIIRETLEQHLTTNCPARLVPCPYFLQGCDAKVKRLELADHLDKSTQTHLELVSRKLLSAEQELTITRRLVEEQNQKIEYLEDEQVNIKLKFLVSQFQVNSDDGAESEVLLGSTPAPGKMQEAFQLAYDNYSNLRYTEAVSILKPLAPKNHADAQYLLGQCFWFGRGVPISKLMGAKWFARAALHGQVAALNALASCFISGDPLFGDDHKFAAQLWEKASIAGSESATFHLANAYQEGKGVKVDLERAEKFLEKAADGGSRRAQQQLKQLRKRKEEAENKNLGEEEVKEVKEEVRGRGLADLVGVEKEQKKGPPPAGGPEKVYLERDDTRASLFGGVLSLLGRGLSPNSGKERKEKKDVPKIYFGEKLTTYPEFNNSSSGFPFVVEGKIYATSEHFFQTQKYKGNPALMEEIRLMKTSFECFSAGRTRKFSTNLRKDWGEVREGIMQQSVREKFKQNPPLMKLLLATGDAEIIRSDTTDGFWGDGGDGRGYNRLGKIIMAIRDGEIV